MGKNFSWSFSRLKNFETCPKRHNEIDLLKNFKEPETETLRWGDQVHKTFAQTLRTRGKLPPEMLQYQPWIDKVLAGPGRLLVEEKYAITADYKPTTFFAHDAWLRIVVDALRIDGPVALALDWKTGSMKIDSVQLLVTAHCLFVTYPQLKRVRAEFVWLKDDCSTPEVYDREIIANEWPAILDRVSHMQTAAANNNYPEKPSGLCKRYCAVASCKFHGKGAR